MLTTSTCVPQACMFFFFFNDTATTEIYTLSLHDALPISNIHIPQTVSNSFSCQNVVNFLNGTPEGQAYVASHGDRKSTRLNSSHLVISYAVFCLKKKKNK